MTVDELMAGVRAAVARRGGRSTAPTITPTATVALAPTLPQTDILLDQAQQLADIGTRVPPFGVFGPFRRPLARFVTRGLYYLLQVITTDQRVFNGLLVSALRIASNGLQQGEANLNAHLAQLVASLDKRDRRLDQLEAELDKRDRRLDQLEAELDKRDRRLARMDERLDEIDKRSAQLESSLAEEALAAERTVNYLKSGLAMQERRLDRILDAKTEEPSDWRSSQQLAVMSEEKLHLLDSLYVLLEDNFRGTREEITERLQVYLPVIRAAQAGTPTRPVLDLGCGRGEWLDILHQEGLNARGIEINRAMIQRCHERGLEPIEGDAITTLRNLPDGSVGAVTAFHLIEHLSLESLIALLDETVRVLQTDGVAIFETPNPDNILVGSCSFYLDPTHRHPLPSPLVRFLVEARGMCRVEVMPLHPRPEPVRLKDPDLAELVNKYFCGAQDYAVIGFKA